MAVTHSGARTHVGTDHHCPAGITRNLHVCVDSAGELEESDENNNITATSASGSDLSASLLSVDETACPDEITLRVRIGNSGDTALSAGVQTAFYDGEPGNGGMLIGVSATTQALEPGRYEDLESGPPAKLEA